jgi:hypothetical protein
VRIQLERNPRSDSGQFQCAVCEGNCHHNPIRTLLCHDNGLSVGDICSTCLHQPIDRLHQLLRQRSVRLINQPLVPEKAGMLSPHKLALELTELAHQPLVVPPFYVWWWKRLTIVTAATRELEAARIRARNCQGRRSRSIDIKFSNEEPSNKE